MIKLKKLFLPIAALALVFSAFIPKALAADMVHTYVAQGVVDAVDHGPSVGATVTVACNGYEYVDITDDAGFFQVFFSADPVVECPDGSIVTATAVNGEEWGQTTGPMVVGTETAEVMLHIALLPIQMVPEFGLITGGLASLVSGGLFLLKKRA